MRYIVNNSSSNPSKSVSVVINSNQRECEDKKGLHMCVYVCVRRHKRDINLGLFEETRQKKLIYHYSIDRYINRSQ